MEKFIDRYHAGKLLAKELAKYKYHPDTIVLALPRGGVPLAYVIATELSLPLDIFLVRKIGVPQHRELAMGAIATGGIVYFNQSIIRDLIIPQKDINKVIGSETIELERRKKIYRGNKPAPNITGKTIILVDDGIATGATARVAIKAIRAQKPKNIILVVPVAAKSTLDEIESDVDKIFCPLKPVNFYAFGLWYENFAQTSGDEVRELLAKADNNLNNND
jgi:predicted phosphoribosyltransferase